jgi:hypothetical protein
MATKKRTAPVNVRQQVSRWEAGAHLYATFGSHWKAGAASLIPFAVVYFTAQPLGSAIQGIAMGGYTIAPFIVAVFATSWAGISYGLLRLLRMDQRVWVHYVVWMVTGAIALLIGALAILTLVTFASEGGASPTEHQSWNTMLWAAPLFGALGSLIGRFVLRNYISWHVWIVRKPLPPVFDFVEGKRDKNEFERM